MYVYVVFALLLAVVVVAVAVAVAVASQRPFPEQGAYTKRSCHSPWAQSGVDFPRKVLVLRMPIGWVLESKSQVC